MEPSRNKRSLMSVVAEAESTLQELLYDRPMAWLQAARERMRDLPKTNFELGCKFAEMGKWHDALFRFRVTLYLQPAYPQAHYNLGCCYYRLGQRSKARAEFRRVLQAEPGNQDAIFMLASIDPQALSPNQRPQTMPEALVTKFFGSLAADYNLTEAENKYRGGVLVAEQVKPLLPTSDITVVDLGCGTGIAAIPYRSIAAEIIGVDRTPEMVEQAALQAQQEQKLFDRVVTADITALGDALAAGSADLVLLVNVVQFVGRLQEVMAEAARLLKPSGYIAVPMGLGWRQIVAVLAITRPMSNRLLNRLVWPA